MATITTKPWAEPAHPVLVRQFEDLITIYRFIRQQFQEQIDRAFDSVSRQIGFVVATTLPVSLQVTSEGKIGKMVLGAKNLDGTIFEREFSLLFKEMNGQKVGSVKLGEHTIQLVWYDALKLKLRADWMEPAHWIWRIWMEPAHVPNIRIRPEISEQGKVSPEVQEPAHWFDAGIALTQEEKILIVAIDEVYPELKLSERIAMERQEARLGPEPEPWRQANSLIIELASLLKKYGIQ